MADLNVNVYNEDIPANDPLADENARSDEIGNGNRNQEEEQEQPPWGPRLEAIMTTMQAIMTGLRTDMTTMQATMQRTESHRHNQAHMDMREGGPPQLQPLAKLQPGRGAGGLRPRPAGKRGHQLPEGFVDGEIGATCQEYFPRNVADLLSMDNRRIHTLSVWYNENFGIDEGDNLHTKCAKFQNLCRLAY